MEKASNVVRIAVVGKYVKLKDAYKSLNEALKFGAVASDATLEIEWADSESLEVQTTKHLEVTQCAGYSCPRRFWTKRN